MDVAGDSDVIKPSYLFEAVGLQWLVEPTYPPSGSYLRSGNF